MAPRIVWKKLFLSKIIKLWLLKSLTKCQKMEVCRYAAVAAMLNAFLCMCQVFWTFPPVITWPWCGGMDSAWFAVRATAVYLRYLNIASSPCACVKKCQSNSYLTSFWPEAFFKNLFKMLPAKYFNWTIEKVCPPTLSSGPECPVHYSVC